MKKVLDLETFVTHLGTVTRKAGYMVEKQEGAALWVNIHGNSLRCNLERVYQAYRGAPDRLPDIVKAHLSALKQVPPTPMPITEEEAGQALLPLLQSSSWLKRYEQNPAMEKDGGQPKALLSTTPLPNLATPPAMPALLRRPFVSGIVIVYVFDFPSHRAYVNANMMDGIIKNSNSSLDDIHEYALKNLQLRAEKHRIDVHGSYARMLITCETQDGYAAASILLPDLMNDWAKRLPGRMLIGIPNRDFIIAFSDQHPSGVDVIAEQVRRDASQRQHPLLSRLLLWEAGKIREHRPLH